MVENDGDDREFAGRRGNGQRRPLRRLARAEHDSSHVGSLLFLLVLFGWTGQWEGALLLGWIASGAVVFSRFGERVAVRVGAGFRRPTKAQAALLVPPWATALARCGLAVTDVDLYVQRSRDPNAFAAGGRSVAVTTGVLAKFQADRLGDQCLMAILVHDLLTAPVTAMPEMPAA